LRNRVATPCPVSVQNEKEINIEMDLSIFDNYIKKRKLCLSMLQKYGVFIEAKAFKKCTLIFAKEYVG
jgi:hypothetical protein